MLGPSASQNPPPDQRQQRSQSVLGRRPARPDGGRVRAQVAVGRPAPKPASTGAVSGNATLEGGRKRAGHCRRSKGRESHRRPGPVPGLQPRQWRHATGGAGIKALPKGKAMDVRLVTDAGVEHQPVEALEGLCHRDDGFVWVDVRTCDHAAMRLSGRNLAECVGRIPGDRLRTASSMEEYGPVGRAQRRRPP